MFYIAKCKNKDCIKKEECARFNSTRNTCDAYFKFENLCGEKNNYKWFYEKKEEDVEEIVENNDEEETND